MVISYFDVKYNSCLVQNPRFTHVDTPLIDNGTNTMVLYNTAPGWEGGSLCKLPSECFPSGVAADSDSDGEE